MRKIFTTIVALVATLTVSAQHGQYVGGDISDLPLYEEHNSGYLDADGNKIDNLLTWFKNDCGWNSFRVRLFVNPSKKDQDGTTNNSVCQDIEYVKTLGKRIKDAGANFVLDFHYSDTWVDATHIQAPAVCQSMTVDQKAEWIYTYTKESLAALIDAGAKPDFVQIGNEIMYGFMGIKVAPYETSGTDWTGFLKVLGQASKAVREACPTAKIIVHTDRPCNAAYNKYWYGKLDAAGIDYDIIGLSFYPFWHGYLTASQNSTNLQSALTSLKSDFPTKKVQIMETGYYFQWFPSSGNNFTTSSTWAGTADGQYNFIKDLIAALKDYDNVDGLYYWFPEEAGCGDDTDWDTQSVGTVIPSWQNRGFWWEDTQTNGHWPVKSSNGMAAYLFKDFLSADAAGINSAAANANVAQDKAWYTISGQKISSPTRPGLYINNGKKVVIGK